MKNIVSIKVNEVSFMLYMVAYSMNPNTYTILNTLNLEVRTLGESDIMQYLTPKSKIENLKVEKNKVKGVRGELKRYCPMGIGYVPVILYKLEDDIQTLMGYRIYDMNGEVRDLSVDDTINIALQYGFSNAKVVTNKNKSYISSIGGSFPVKVVRNQVVELERIVVEITRRSNNSFAVITLTDIQGRLSRQKITLENQFIGYPDGPILGKVFNKFLKYRLYDIIDGRRQPVTDRPAGVVISKSAYYKDDLSAAEYQKVADYLGIQLEKVMDKQSSCVYQIKL